MLFRAEDEYKYARIVFREQYNMVVTLPLPLFPSVYQSLNFPLPRPSRLLLRLVIYQFNVK